MATILCIDEDPQMGSLVRRVLEAQGHDVHVAVNGMEGETMMRQHPVDLLIADIFMLDMDGIELLLKLRALIRNPRVLVISGGGRYDSGRTVLDMARMLGVRHILLKPFMTAALLDAVTRAIEDQPLSSILNHNPRR